MNGKANKKKIIIAVIILLIPIAVIGYIFFSNFKDDISEGKILECTVSFGEEKMTFEDDDTKALLFSVIENGEKVDAPLNSIDTYTKCSVEFKKVKALYKYDFLLTKSSSDCLYIGLDGGYFRIPSEIAEKLYLIPIIEKNVVAYVNPPEISLTSNDVTVIAGTANGKWTSKKASGSVEETEVAKTSNEIFVLPKSSGLKFSSTVEPDFCDIKIKNEIGETLFSGDGNSVSGFSLEKDTRIHIEIECEWFETENVLYFGEIKYEIEALYDVKATASILSENVRQGSTVGILIKDSNASNLAVTSPFIADRPVVISDDSTKLVLINVPCDTDAQSYKINLLGSDIEKEFDIKIEKNTSQERELPKVLSDSINAVTDTVKGFSVTPFAAFDGFSAPIPENKIRIHSYDLLPDKNAVSGFTVYSLQGLTDIASSSAGKVVFDGEVGTLGKCVIVDNGFGIYSLYLSLDEISVKKNDTVSKEDIIGRKNGEFYFGIMYNKNMTDCEQIMNFELAK